MHYARLLPPLPVELKRCQEYFLNPPSHVTQPNLVCDEIMKWKGMGWRLRRLLKHYPTLNDMTQGFTTLLKGVMEDNPTFQVKYQFYAMPMNSMNLTSDQLIDFFTKVESLLTEFHSSRGYTTVLAPLVELSTKKPKANGADAGDKPKDNPKWGKKGEGKGDPKGGKKGEGKGKNDGRDPKKPSTKDGKPQNPTPPPGGPSAGGGKRAD
eukprot:1268399-Amphidinium_carterae.1